MRIYVNKTIVIRERETTCGHVSSGSDKLCPDMKGVFNILADQFMPVHLSLSKLIPHNIITHSSQVQLLHGTHYLLKLYHIHLYFLSEVLYVFSYRLLFVLTS